jgi:hypothetical protein
MERELKNIKMEIFILDNMLMDAQRELENIFFQMALVTKVNLKMVSGTEKAFGKEEWAQMLIDMMEIIKMIKNAGSGLSHGQLEIIIKVIFSTI